MSAGRNASAPDGRQTRSSAQDRSLSLRRDTLDEEARTVEVVWAAGAPVQRYDWWESENYIEELSMDPDHIRLGRFANGMSFLNGHRSGSMEDRLGTVIPGSVRIVNGLGIATVRISRNAGGEALMNDLKDGHPFPVSVGYRTHAYRRTEASGESIARLTATDWEPYEISAVPIPADPSAHSRSEEQGIHHMPGPADLDELYDVPATRSQPPQRPTASPAVLAERERIATITGLARMRPNDVTMDTLSRAIENGISVSDFRAQMLDAVATRQEQADTFNVSPMRAADHSRNEEFQARLIDVLAGRSSNGGGIARQFLESQGVRTGGMSDRDIGRTLNGGGGSVWGGQSRAMHATNDFNLIVGAAASAVLLERFQANPSALKKFSKRRNAPDFRNVNYYRLGEAPPLLKVNEHGEIKSGTLREESNGFRIETYARMFGLTYQASVNDGLGAFRDFLQIFAEAVIQLESNLFALLLSDHGPRMDDGLELFHANHGNIAEAGAPPTIETVNDGVIAMRTQKNVNRNDYAGTAPSAILVGPRLELKTKQLVAAIQATDTANVNPHRLEVVVEDRFGREFEGWYLLADPTRRPTFVHGGLEEEGDVPQIDSKQGWEVLGTQYRVVHNFGVGAYDYRAIYFNQGK